MQLSDDENLIDDTSQMKMTMESSLRQEDQGSIIQHTSDGGDENPGNQLNNNF